MRLATHTALAVFILDQASKIIVVWYMGLARKQTIDILPPWLNFRMAWNRGMNFGMFADNSDVTRWGLIVIALAISAWVWIWMRREAHSRLMQVAAGLLIGGALGNVVDRLLYGAVADFLNMSCCGIENPFAFNVADVAIFLGAIGLVLFSGKDRPGAKPRRKTP